MKEAKQMVEESDIKYDEVARKLAMVRTFATLHLKKSFVFHMNAKFLTLKTILPYIFKF